MFYNFKTGCNIFCLYSLQWLDSLEVYVHSKFINDYSFRHAGNCIHMYIWCLVRFSQAPLRNLLLFYIDKLSEELRILPIKSTFKN